MRIQLLVDSGRRASILDLMRDGYGITGAVAATSTPLCGSSLGLQPFPEAGSGERAELRPRSILGYERGRDVLRLADAFELPHDRHDFRANP